MSVVVKPGERPAALEGELAPCPLCGHLTDARQVDLYSESLYIDRVSELGKFLEGQGLRDNGRGLVVRSPTFTTAPAGGPARRRVYIPGPDKP